MFMSQSFITPVRRAVFLLKTNVRALHKTSVLLEPEGCDLDNTNDSKGRNSSRKNRSSSNGQKLVVVDGTRTPFLVSGTGYSKMLAYELARQSLLDIIKKTGLTKETVDYIVFGTMIQEVKTSNIAREAALTAGFPDTTPAHTIGMSCISSHQSITTAMGLITSGACNVIIAGGVEFTTDLPIRFPRAMRSLMLRANRAKTPGQKLQLLSSLRPGHFCPERPTLVEFSTGEAMCRSVDRLVTEFNVTREEQDEFAIRSHSMADEARTLGYFTDLVPFAIPGTQNVIKEDNGIREVTIEDLRKLKPDKDCVNVTNGNSPFLTDGASACLITTESKAKELDLIPKVYLKEFVYVAEDPKDHFGHLGKAFAISRVLQKAGLKVDDIDVWEMHESCSGQFLANLKALDSDSFAQNHMNHSKVGAPDMGKINNWGGSLSIGHPFGATGVRLVMHAANRLIREDGQLAVVASCAAGGQGVGMIVERYPDGFPD